MSASANVWKGKCRDANIDLSGSQQEQHSVKKKNRLPFVHLFLQSIFARVVLPRNRFGQNLHRSEGPQA